MSDAATEAVLVSFDNGIAELIINRPQALNALNKDVLHALEQRLAEVQEKSDVRALIITGAGEKAFVAGADIAAMTKMSPQDASEFAKLGHRVFNAIEHCPVPVLAAVNGFALGGGCELAIACDAIYASSRAKFGQPEVKLGLIPGFGGSVRLAKRIGYGAASEWIYGGDIYDAQEALRLGLVVRVYEPNELHEKVREVARTIASRAPLAVRAAKKVIRAAQERSHHDALNYEVETFSPLFASADTQEGVRAFVEKRNAEFKGL